MIKLKKGLPPTALCTGDRVPMASDWVFLTLQNSTDHVESQLLK